MWFVGFIDFDDVDVDLGVFAGAHGGHAAVVGGAKGAGLDLEVVEFEFPREPGGEGVETRENADSGDEAEDGVERDETVHGGRIGGGGGGLCRKSAIRAIYSAAMDESSARTIFAAAGGRGLGSRPWARRGMAMAERVRGLAWAAAVLLAVVSAAPSALGQAGSGVPGGTAPSEVAPGSEAAGAGAAGVGVAGPSIVTLESSELGPGGLVRRGAFVSARLRLRLNDAEGARNVVARVHLDDVDGDTALWERQVTLTAGVERDVFLYFPAPWGVTAGDVVLLTFHEATEAGTAGALIGDARLLLPEAAPSDATFLGVVGDAPAGLEQYELPYPGRSGQQERIAASNVHIEVVRGLSPQTLPDRWFGLDAFTTLVWTGGEPSGLSAARADALVEWVRRGGHLVVVLPTLADIWLEPDANPVHRLLPDASVTRHDSVSLEAYRNLLTRPEYARAPMPDGKVVFSFEARDAARTSEAACVLAGPEGCVAIRRIAGAGMVTVVGLPVADRDLHASGIFRADAFWHRVLGYRFDIPSPRMLSQNTSLQSQLRQANSTLEEQRYVDDVIAREIGRSETAAAGLLLALVVFIVYWLLAGPVGFFVLRQRGMERHAWVAFVGATAVFAAIAWLGARAISPGSASVAHVTVIDQVFGQPDEHVRSWGAVLLPDYGDRTIAAGYADRPSEAENLLQPFASPTEESVLSFPDAREYVADIESAARLTVPARGTVKQFAADWRGPARTGMPAPPTLDAAPRLNSRRELLGLLRHELPAAIRDAELYVVGPQLGEVTVRDMLTDQTQRADLSPPRAVIAQIGLGDWAPGTTIDLANLNVRMTNLSPRAVLNESEPLGGDRRLFNASFIGALEQPNYAQRSSAFGAGARDRFTARLTQDLDLSRWTTQPAVIVIGLLDGEAMAESASQRSLFGTPGPGGAVRPLPVASGVTVLRWIAPLEPRPVVFLGR